jgi:formylglycine-generating enzyme required for sulfatase activity
LRYAVFVLVCLAYQTALTQEPPPVVEGPFGIKFVKIPAGEFEMGTNDRFVAEMPAHRVQISKPFLLSQTEITQWQWQQVMGTTPWDPQKFVIVGDKVAASYISWGDANKFCATLTQKEGLLRKDRAYRLPTEAEWEYACRAGTKTEWSFGDDADLLDQYAFANLLLDTDTKVRERYTHEVGKKKPNAWGLYDMHGNVAELCADWYGQYAEGVAIDPQGPREGSLKVLRGGCWMSDSGSCRSAHRMRHDPSKRGSCEGFRVALTLP